MQAKRLALCALLVLGLTVATANAQIVHTVTQQNNEVVQFGLTEAEVDAVWSRIEDLIASVDAGELPVF